MIDFIFVSLFVLLAVAGSCHLVVLFTGGTPFKDFIRNRRLKSFKEAREIHPKLKVSPFVAEIAQNLEKRVKVMIDRGEYLGPDALTDTIMWVPFSADTEVLLARGFTGIVRLRKSNLPLTRDEEEVIRIAGDECFRMLREDGDLRTQSIKNNPQAVYGEYK